MLGLLFGGNLSRVGVNADAAEVLLALFLANLKSNASKDSNASHSAESNANNTTSADRMAAFLLGLLNGSDVTLGGRIRRGDGAVAETADRGLVTRTCSHSTITSPADTRCRQLTTN